MQLARAAVCFSVVCGVVGGDLQFPPGFKFGAATAAYQVEGGWNASDKSESIWDHLVHSKPDAIADGTSGDVACNSYQLWRTDIQMAKDLGLDFYRFSISWPRLLPNGFANYISEDGKKYYNNLIDELLRNGIEPLVTIYHWDLPQRLQNLGGWNSPLVVEWFSEYARVVFSLFGDRVKIWLTINEPMLICDVAHRTHHWGSGFYDPLIAPYICSRHVLLAHAKAWRIYDEEFRPKYNGKVSLANHVMWYVPSAPEHEELTELALQLVVGRYNHPIYSKKGGWPPSVENYIAKKSKEEGYPRSRLPPFSKKEIELLRGTSDFLCVNYYTTQTVRPAAPGEAVGEGPLFDVPELNIATSGRPEWEVAENGWLQVYPEGLRELLVWMRQQYGDMEVAITENGYATVSSQLRDHDRLQYYRDHLKQLLIAIKKDGINVTAFTAWSLMDNFEWVDGLQTKFGLYEVDFADPMRLRTPRLSARYYRDVIRTRSLDHDLHSYYKDEL